MSEYVQNMYEEQDTIKVPDLPDPRIHIKQNIKQKQLRDDFVNFLKQKQIVINAKDFMDTDIDLLCHNMVLKHPELLQTWIVVHETMQQERKDVEDQLWMASVNQRPDRLYHNQEVKIYNEKK